MNYSYLNYERRLLYPETNKNVSNFRILTSVYLNMSMFLKETRILISSHCMRFHSRQFQGELRPLPIAQENMSIRMTNRNVSCLVRRNN